MATDLEDEVTVFLRAYGDAFVREVVKQVGWEELQRIAAETLPEQRQTLNRRV